MKINFSEVIKMQQNNYLSGALMVIFSAFCFALKGIFIKIAYRYGIDTISLLTLRMLFSAPFYILIAVWISKKQDNMAISKNQWQWIAGLGIIGYYLSSFFDFESLNYITAHLERVLLFVYPTFVLFINAFFRKKPISKLQDLALGVTYFGIILAFSQNIETQQKDILLGAFWVILAGLIYACYLVGGDKIIPQVGSNRFTVYALLFATVPVVVHCFIKNQLHIWHYPKQIYVIGITMAIFVTVIPTFAMSEGIRRVGSGNTAIMASSGPIFTIVLATVFLGEQIAFLQIIGTLFVLLGVFLIGWKGEK